ncbi:MAG TPA: MarR family transcriptional regulator [Acidimicrobiales bacterium]|nr:MarR family transcriptional regulator [Acidimicrobiales bacterium]
MTVESLEPPPRARVRWLTAEEQQVWRRLLSVESRLRDRLDRDLREAHALTLGEYEVLVHLSEAGPTGVRMSDLAELLLLSRSGLTRRIDSLVRAGLVARRSCPVDGRGSMAELTVGGRSRLAEAAPTHVAGVRRYLIDVLGGHIEGLAGGLSRVEEALDRG